LQLADKYEANNIISDPRGSDMLLGIINLLPNPVYVKDRSHRWVELNAAFCKFLGYPREVLLGKSDFDFTPKEQAQIFWEMDNEVFSSKTENVNLEEITNSAGDVRWVESKKSYYRSTGGEEYIIGILTDVTEMKMREVELVKAQKKALAGAEAKTNFLANMSHEIRTPMNGVLGMSQILRNTELTETQLGMIDTLERSGEVLLRLIDDILDFSKLDAGQMTLCDAPFSLKDLVDDVAALSGVMARNKDLDLIVNFPSELHVGLIGDSDRITQILTNLIGNAIKFTSEGYILLAVSGQKIDEACELKFSVKDTGIGIAPEKLSTIFEKFQQADGSTTRIYGGTGLGLSISKELALIMGGTLTASSEVDAGSIFDFTVTLPVTNLEPRQSPTPIDRSAISKLRVLAVDDIDLNLESLRLQLEPLSLTLECVSNAKDAAKALSEALLAGEPYSLLVTDYQMPNIDGLKLTQSLRNHPKFSDLKIMVLSSVNDNEVRQAFLDLNVANYIVKPTGQAALYQALNDIALSL